MAKSKERGEKIRQDPTEEQFRVNLKLFIEQSGYTANQVADLSGVAQATLGRYLRGENAISVDALVPLSQALGRDPGDFFKVDPPPPPPNLNETQPMLLKARPGVTPTKEDIAAWNEYIEGVKSRRAKKGRANKS